jgi:hypothetical protein
LSAQPLQSSFLFSSSALLCARSFSDPE